MATILDMILINAAFRAFWAWVLWQTFTFLFKKAAQDFKKEGIKGIWQEVLLILVSIVGFAILILLNPSQYLIPLVNLVIGLYNFIATSYNSTLRDIIRIPITMPIFSPIA